MIVAYSELQNVYVIITDGQFGEINVSIGTAVRYQQAILVDFVTNA